MKVKSILLAVLFLAGCVPNIQSQTLSSSPSRIEQVHNSVVALVRPTRDELEDMGIDDVRDIRGTDSVNTVGREHSPYCAGIVVSEDEILTAAHCVQRYEYMMTIFGPIAIPSEESPLGDMKKITFYSQYMSEGGKIYSYRMTRVVKWDNVQDLALLRVEPNQEFPEGYRIAELGNVPVLGQNAYAVGHSAGIPWTFTDGLISRVKRETDEGQITTQTTALSWYGNSGGPLLNDQGRVIGVCSWGAGRTSHLVFFVHVDSISDFLDE